MIWHSSGKYGITREKSSFAHRTSEGTVVNGPAFREKAREILKASDEKSLEEKFEKRRELAALAGVASLEAIEGDYMTLNIYRDNPATDFLEMRDLPLGTVPIFRTRYENPVGIFQSGLAGHGSSLYYQTTDNVAQVTPFTIQSEEVMLPNLNNIYDMERLQQRAVGLRRMAEFMNMAIVNLGLNTVLGASDIINTDPAVQIASYFSGGGSFAGKSVYTLDPGVVPAGVPTLNVYDLSAEGGLTKTVFRTLNTHQIQIGRPIRKILVPNAGAPWEALQNQASIVTAQTGAPGNPNPAKAITPDQWAAFQSDDWEGSVGVQWFGHNFLMQRQNWLPQGYCLVLTEQPAAIMWDRLSLQTGEMAEGTVETPVNGYYSRRSEARNIAMIRPDYCLRNFLVIKVQ